ncbi:hypothetical protein HPB48_013196 [Haemaphysalis longicornis]|uniref:Uncharacterized protein n=1 Tax=Haemaphysalis longicornis TaxID=44386 RepID=A0A9J6FHX4_HAELO|nr:hypothetical protein HPB48_013196 [Haemaphysalis longicornis]
MTTIPTKADRALDGDPPEVVVDQKGKKTFVRGKFLGKLVCNEASDVLPTHIEYLVRETFNCFAHSPKMAARIEGNIRCHHLRQCPE